MGIWSFLTGAARAELAGSGPAAAFSESPVVDAIAARAAAAADGPGAWSAPVTREFALNVPAVLRGRNIICSISTLPLQQFRLDSMEPAASSFLAQIDPQTPNVVTLAQTVEDLLFEGISWWQVTGFAWDGFPASARHVDLAQVSLKPPPGVQLQHLPSGIDPASVVWVEGKPVDGRDMIRFDSPNPPLLKAGRRAIRRAALLDAAAAMYAEDPAAREYFVPAEGADPSDDEVQEILNDWVASRRRRATGYVPDALELRQVESPSPADLQLAQLQGRASLDLANALGLDPEDLGVSTTSRTYQNATDRRRDRINDTLSPYMLAITSRLSMNDVTRRGYGTRFDLADYLKADPKTQAEVAAIYLDRGAWTRDEARTAVGYPALRPDQQPDQPAAPLPAAAGQNSSPAPVLQLAQAEQIGEQRVSIPATFSVDTEAAAPVEASADRPSVRRVTFAVPAGQACFTVDVEKRTVSGLAVPYGEVTSDWRQIQFRAGSIGVPTPLSRVKAMLNHYGALLGTAASVTDSDTGLSAKLSIAKTQAGDEALALADAGALDGLSVGVDIHTYEIDTETDVMTVTSATLREISLTPFPAFDSARVENVNLTEHHQSQKGDSTMTVAANGTTTPAAAPAATTPAQPAEQQPAAVPAQFAQPAAPAVQTVQLPADFAEQVAAAVAAAAPARETVNPVRPGTATLQVAEALPYRLDGRKGEHEFSSDLFASIRHQDGAAKARIQAFMREAFVSKANVATINPSIQRPDLFVDEKSFSTPLWDAVNKGTIDDSTPFILPNFTSASNVVADHTEGTEPTAGTYVTGSQTITPAPMSGKFPLVREIVDQGGNPQLSQIIWAKIRRAWAEALEAKVAALLNASSASTITITTAAADKALAKEFRTKLAALQFVRGGFRFTDLDLHVDLYTAMIGAQDDTGRPLFPFLEGGNANAGSVDTAWGAIRAAGLVGNPAWALGATGTASANSFLFDAGDVSGWATEPRDLNLADQDVANVYIGVWGYQATAVTDVTGVRKLAYDPV